MTPEEEKEFDEKFNCPHQTTINSICTNCKHIIAGNQAIDNNGNDIDINKKIKNFISQLLQQREKLLLGKVEKLKQKYVENNGKEFTENWKQDILLYAKKSESTYSGLEVVYDPYVLIDTVSQLLQRRNKELVEKIKKFNPEYGELGASVADYKERLLSLLENK